MLKTYTLDQVVRREIKRPDLLNNATLTLDFLDDLVEAFRADEVVSYVRTFDESIRRRPLTPTLSDFWLHYQINAPEYMVTGRGLITDRYWQNAPSYEDIRIDARTARRWLFRRKLARMMARLFKAKDTPGPFVAGPDVQEVIAKAVEDHIHAKVMKPDQVFRPRK